MITLIILYGSLQARKDATAILENLPHIKRVDTSADMSVLRLSSEAPLKEKSLIPLLAKSGISGFKLEDNNQALSRKGAPLSL